MNDAWLESIVEEAREVLAAKTRSYVGASRRLAKAVEIILASQRHWKARALDAEARARRLEPVYRGDA